MKKTFLTFALVTLASLNTFADGGIIVGRDGIVVVGFDGGIIVGIINALSGAVIV